MASPVRVELTRPGLGNLAPNSVGGDKYCMPSQHLHLANQTVNWLPSDTIVNYTPVLKNGQKNLFGPRDITYQFNEHGFRCDSFDLPSELPIVYLGCSHTEGIGLPIESTWAYLLTEKIRQHTNKQIPFWSLAQGGRGMDNQIDLLYEFVCQRPVKYIFCFFPSSGRREFYYNSESISHWIPNPIAHKNSFADVVGPLFTDPFFINHEETKSLSMLDLIRRNQQAQVVISSWGFQIALSAKNLTKAFPEFKTFPLVMSAIPDYARDNQHPGVEYHRQVADQYWELARHLF